MTEIRLGSLADLPALVDFGRKEKLAVEKLADALSDTDSCVVVALVGGELAGFGVVRINERGGSPQPGRLRQHVKTMLGRGLVDADSILRPLRYGVLAQLGVAQSARDEGIGSALISRGNLWLRERSVRHVLATTPAQNDPGRRDLLRSLGFEPFRYVVSRRL